MGQLEKLQEKARVLREILGDYAKIDSDVENVLNLISRTLDEIQAGRIYLPRRDEFRWYFFNTAPPFFMKYKDLSRAEAEYAEILEGWDLKTRE
jgi:hypothetical protein